MYCLYVNKKERRKSMTVEVALVISAVSLAFGIWQGMSNIKRNNKRDDQTEASNMTTVIVKLENIKDGVTEIKSELYGLKSEVKDLTENGIRNEESIKQAHKRIDSMEKKLSSLERTLLNELGEPQEA